MGREPHMHEESGRPVDPAVTHDDDHVHDAAPSSYDETVVKRRSAWYWGDIVSRVNAVLVAVLLTIEALLTMRFLFLAFGASRDSGFVEFVMDVSWPFVRPFADAFANRTWDEGIIEVNTLLAMGVWLLLFALAMALLSALLPRRDDADARYERRRVTHV